MVEKKHFLTVQIDLKFLHGAKAPWLFLTQLVNFMDLQTEKGQVEDYQISLDTGLNKIIYFDEDAC